MDVLQLDVSGRPQAWISPREAAVLYASHAVAWTLGDTFQVLRGGIQRATGMQSRIELHPIVAVRGAMPSRAWRSTPAITNPKLFARDLFICSEKSYSSIPIHFFRGVLQSGVAGFSNKPIRAWRAPPSQGPR
ncbi:MAG: hypothetical protein O9321_17350, partial [Rubrivivax sp.]|nr:hypothetical protein [Rubrivivax sp.]